MTKTYFPDPRLRQRLYDGPLAVCIDAFAERLTRQGYCAATARERDAVLRCAKGHREDTA